MGMFGVKRPWNGGGDLIVADALLVGVGGASATGEVLLSESLPNIAWKSSLQRVT